MEWARIGGPPYHPILTRRMEWSGIGGKQITPPSRDAWSGPELVEKRSHHDHERRVDGQVMGYIRNEVVKGKFIQPRDPSWSVKPLNQTLYPRDANDVECAPRKKNDDQKAQDLDAQATQPPTSELVVALKALSLVEEPPPPPPQTVNELMEGTLKEYKEECVEEGTFPSDPAPEVGE